MSPATWVGASLDPLADANEGRPLLIPARMFERPDPGTTRRGFQRSCVVLPPGTDAFARWWAERTFDGVLGLCGDWALEEATTAFAHDVALDPGLGVDAWNVIERVVGRDTDLQIRGGGPLRTFHFDEFEPRRVHLAVADSGTRPPVLLSEHPALLDLHAQYASLLMQSGYEETRAESYVWAHLPGGTPVDRALRHAFRAALRERRLDGGADPPDPFSPGGVGRLVEFLNEPAVQSAGRYSRYVLSLYESWPGLSAVFPDVMAGDRQHFVWWLNHFARCDAPIASVFELPSVSTPAATTRARGHGVNVAGYLLADSGLAVSARRTIDALQSVDVQTRRVTYRRTLSRQTSDASDDRGDGLFDVNLVCVTAEQFPFFRADMGEDLFTGRYTIGYWYWELEVFSPDQLGALEMVDEVWVATRHVYDAIAPLTDTPVLHMPIPLSEPHPSGRTRASFGVPEGYVFLFAFDFDSVMARKNPLGVVSAFLRAFPTEGEQHLVLKSVNAARWPAEAELLRCAIAGRPDVTLIDGYLSEADQAALVSVSDCYVSLHRAEGLGLTLADAMALGKPVIATGYSGNVDFMNDDNSLLVPFTYTSVPTGTPAYPAGAPWADPDIMAAAQFMRALVANPEAGRRVGSVARRDILNKWTREQAGARMRERLQEVWTRG
jgi:glycosyltransferase involved in cell wall biosynthesis